MARSILSVSVVVMAALIGASAPSWASDRGEAVFNDRCARCHGEAGKGADKGPPLVHRVYHPNHHSDLSFRWAVARGVRAHHWGFGDMPPVEGVSAEDIEAVITYVRRLQREAGIY